MKQIVTIIALLMLLAGASCGGGEARRSLDAASELLADHPDSALAILSRLDTASLSRRARARHALYTICARNKSGEELDSSFTTLFNISDAYFLKPTDLSKECMFSYYYNGLKDLNDSLYADAIINMLFSEERAIKLSDNTQLGLVYRSLADAYSALCDNVSALHYSRKSFEAFSKANAKVYLPYAVYDLARMYNNALIFDEALKYGRDAYEIARNDSDTLLMSESISLMGMSYCGMHDYENAANIYELFDSLHLPYAEARDVLLRGLSFVYIGNMPRAKDFASYMSEMGIDNRLLQANIFKEDHRYKEALDLQIDLYKNADQSLRSLYKQDAAFIISQHYQMQRKSALRLAEKQREVSFLVVISSLAIITCLILFILWRRKQNTLRQVELMQQIKGLNEEAEMSKRNMALIQHELFIANSKNELVDVNRQEFECATREIFASRSELLNNLCAAYYEGSITSNEKNKVYTKTKEHIESLRNDPLVLSKMEGMVNKYFDNLINRMRDSSLNLKEAEIKMYIFIIAGMTNRALGIMFDKSSEAIARLKSRLKAKLIKYDADNATEFSKFI